MIFIIIIIILLIDINQIKSKLIRKKNIHSYNKQQPNIMVTCRSLKSNENIENKGQQ